MQSLCQMSLAAKKRILLMVSMGYMIVANRNQSGVGTRF
jgi:hypothetical protein